MTIPLPLQEALRDSIISGTFVDAKFWVFSKRRSGTGRVGGPKPLFVNAHVAKRVPRLGALLDECKNKVNLRTRFPSNKKPYTNNYGYEDDSDLEEDDDDEDDVSDDEPTLPTQVATELRNDSLGNSDTKNNESSDIISVSDLESLFSESPDTKDETNPAHTGKVIVIEDVAFVTFQALLRYLYTNEIEFAPWGSTEGRKARARETISGSYGIPKPSPKSIYRLADKYGIPELRALVLQRIQEDLSKCDVIGEVFSKYTSWYPEIREFELRQLARALLSPDSASTLRLLKEKIEGYTHGRLPHAKHVISALYNLMENDKPIEEIPIPAAAPPNHDTIDEDWTGLKRALTSSLTSGTFLDSQFYAVESRSSTSMPNIRPVYFCSMISGVFISKLMACSSKLKTRKASARFADEYDSDIEDEEPIQESSTDCYPTSKCVRENPTPSDLPLDPALLLNCGAAKTWSAVFLYVYTGQIAFAPVGSQSGISKEVQNGDQFEDEPKPPQDLQGLGVPPPVIITVDPCSPKSIYRLANQVGLTGLCDVAFKDLKSKLDEKYIIQELFSPFTADHKDVREMEHELFQSKLKPLVDPALIHSIIESSSSGEHPYRSAVMGLILERFIQDRLQRSIQTLPKKVLKKKKNRDPTSQPERSTETSTAPIPQVQPIAPVRVPNTLSQPSSSSVMASTETEVQPDTPKPRNETEARSPGEQTNPSSEHTVKLICSCCGTVAKAGIFCWRRPCGHSASTLKCTGCMTESQGVYTIACTNCDREFQ